MIDRETIHVLASWVHSQHRRLSAALTGNHLPMSSVPEFMKMAADLQPLINEITEADTVIDSAVVFINGVPGLIAAAVAQALQNGATAAELKPVTDLGDTLKAKAQALKDALAANTTG
jgi:hypothetical protein